MEGAKIQFEERSNSDRYSYHTVYTYLKLQLFEALIRVERI